MAEENPPGAEPGPPSAGPAPAAPSTSTSTSTGKPEDTGPASQEEALLLLQGDNAERSDSARSAEIVARTVHRLSGKSVNLFMGDVSVGGDFVTGARGATRGAKQRPIDPVDVSNCTYAYVKPPGFYEAYDVLIERHLVVLSAPGRTGRDAAALALLRTVLPDEPLFDLPVSVLGNGSWRVQSMATGYRVTDTTAADTAKLRSNRQAISAEVLDDAWLERASAALKEAGSFLVITTGPVRGKLASAGKRADFVVESLEMPDSLEIVREHVRLADIGLATAETDRQLDNDDLAKLLIDRPHPLFAVKTAIAVIEALRSGEDLSAVVYQLQDPQAQVQEWLEDAGTREIAFAFATATLEESSYLTVADAAINLAKALSGRSDDQSLRYRRALLAEHTWIELASPQEYSLVQEIVRFRSESLQPVVLTLAWYELDGMRPKILEWLKNLVGHSDVEVRARAATAAGILAIQDFQHALHRYLLPWAASKSPEERQSAALALGVVGTLDQHTERIWALLRQWAGEVRFATKPQLPTTAAMAVAGPMGIDDPKQALAVLRTLIEDGDWNLLPTIANSVLLLTEEGRAAEVLAALLDWTEPQDGSISVVKALTAFTITAREPMLDGADGGHSQPLLLIDASQHRESLPELWGRALQNTDVRPLALDALREWLRAVDEDQRNYPVVLDLLAGVVDRGDEDLERINYYLELWAEDRDDPSAAAAHIFNALADAGELP